MKGSQSVPPAGTNTASVDLTPPLVVRIYGDLQKRITAYGKKKGITLASTVKLLTGEALEREGF